MIYFSKRPYVIITVILFFLVLLANVSVAQINFSDKEQEWLNTHDSIVLAVDNTYPPLNFLDDEGNLSGLNIDLVKLIEKRLGIDIIIEGSNWDVALSKALAHEVDGVINASALEERKAYLYFSEGFFKDPLALVSHGTDNTINAIADLKNKRIAVKKDSKHLLLLKAKVPDVQIVEISTLMEGFSYLSANTVDGIYDDLAPLYHLLSSSNLSNMKVAFLEANSEGARIGVRNDDLVLLSILNKGILSISDSERKEIQNKWFEFTPEKDFTLYYIVMGLLLFLVLLIGVWSWSLKLIVNKKTAELKKELQQRRSTEKELRKAKEKAVESDKLKSAFLANMSHEIRTPLNSIIGFSGLLIEDDLSEDEKLAHYNIITSSSNSLLSLINDIIDFSKIEAGYLETHIVQVEIKTIFNELEAIYSVELSKLLDEKEGLTLEIVTDELMLETQIMADKNRLKQIFTVLINNAIKFTDSGVIKIGSSFAPEGMVQFYVEDSGIGIAEEYHDVVFERFRKVEDNVESIFRGAGLGLSIAKQLTELMCGKMWVVSEYGKGSKFYFTLPYAVIN